MLLVWLLIACNGREIRDAAVETAASSLGIMGIHPADGAAGLRGDVAVHVVFGNQTPNRPLDVRVSSSAREWSPPCTLDESGRWMSCSPIRELPRDQVFDIELIRGNGSSIMISAASELPREPRAYRLEDIRVTQFGGNPGAAEQLSSLFSESTLIAVTEGGSLSEGKHTFRMGLADSYGNEVSVRTPGLTMVYDIILREQLGGPPQDVFLPLQIDTEIVPLFIENCTLTASLDEWRITGLALSGTISALSLVKLTDPLGELSDLALSRIEMDVDTDGDGQVDAITFKLVANAPRVKLRSH